MAVVSMVADVTGQDEIELPVLNDWIDGDALNALLTAERPPNSPRRTVSFQYGDASVTIDSEGLLVVAVDS